MCLEEHSIQTPQTENRGNTVFGPLPFKLFKIITTDASSKVVDAIFWKEQSDGKLKPKEFASCFLSNTEKKYAMNERELLAVIWGLKTFRSHFYSRQ